MFLRRIILVFLLIAIFVPTTYAQEGCCQVDADSCSSPVTEAQCEELRGTFHEGGTCRADGRCGVLQETSILPWVGFVIVLVVILVAGGVLIARRRRQSARYA
jgi:hypothetical protein